MAISTYAELQAAIDTFSGRDDQGSTAADYIALGEARINRRLRCRQMVATTTGNVTGASFSLPSDFLGVRQLRLTSGDYTKLEAVTVDKMDELKAQPDVSGAPVSYAVSGLTAEVYPEPAEATPYRLSYFQKIPALSDSNTTNWLLSAWPDLYLYAALVAFGIRTEDERVSAWKAEVEQIIAEIEQSELADLGDRLTPQTNIAIA